jgi:hypothetical protein
VVGAREHVAGALAGRKGIEAMARKPKGHKKSCRCPFCKRARGGGKRKSSSKGKRASNRRTAAQHRKHVRELRKELHQAHTGARRASASGDASSWRSFTSTAKGLERRIASAKR